MSATFTCRSNSHPFQERRVSLAEPAKIGRSVARARPAANNAIFDCKVLSRNHALLWFEEGKFFLKDTKSSNGTFVNNRRLSEGSQESLPFEVNSGDIVQFGVDVVENSRRVTHGCIISQVRLYLPNGEEAKQSDVSVISKVDKVSHSPIYPTIQSQDLYQLHDYLKEALHREQMLEQKLVLLQRLVADSHETSEKGWQALIDEDKLLSRLEFLENQLQTYAKTLSEESMQKELLQLQEEKHNYETTSKKALQLVLGEKLEVQQKLGNLERSYSNAEDECTHLRDTLAKTQKELRELAGKHQKLSSEAQDSEKARQEEKKKFEVEVESHQERIEQLEESERDLQQRLTDSFAEIEKFQGAIKDLQSEMETLKSQLELNNNEKDVSHSEVLNGPANLNEKLNDIISSEENINLTGIKTAFKEDDIEVVKTIELCEKPIEEKMNIVSIPHGECDELQSSVVQETEDVCDGETQDKTLITKLESRIAQLEKLVSEAQSSQKAEEEKRKNLESRLDEIESERTSEKEMLTETTRELQAALSERESLLDQEERLKARIEESEKLLKACETDSISSSSESEDLTLGEDDDDLICSSLAIAKAKLKEFKKKLKEKESELDETKSSLTEINSSVSQKSAEVDHIRSLFEKSEERVIHFEAEILTLRTVSEQSQKLKSELEDARRLAKEQCELYEEAQLKIQVCSESEKDFNAMREQLEKEKSDKDERIKEIEELLTSANEKQEIFESLSKEKSELESNIKEYLEQINALKQFEKDTVELTRQNEQQSSSGRIVVFETLPVASQMDDRVAPHVSGRSPIAGARQPDTKIPKLSVRSFKEDKPIVKTAPSPRGSRLIAPTPSGSRLIAPSPSGSRLIAPTPTVTPISKMMKRGPSNETRSATNVTKPSVPESGIPKLSNSTGKQRALPRTPVSPRMLKRPSKISVPVTKSTEKRERTTPSDVSPRQSTVRNEIPAKDLPKISDAIFERAFKDKKSVESLLEQAAPPGFSDSESGNGSSAEDSMQQDESGDSNFPADDKENVPPNVPPLELHLLDDNEGAESVDNAREGSRRLSEEQLKGLLEEKEKLAKDVQSLQAKMEKGEPSPSPSTDVPDYMSKLEELKKRLQAKQDECTGLQKEKQNLVSDASEQKSNGFSTPLLVAVVAILVGIGYFFLRSG